MANPGNGLRTVADLTVEISGHFLELYVETATTAPVASGVQTVGVGSTEGFYIGCQVVIAGTTLLTITGFDPVALTVTANFATSYPTNTALYGGTFPTQQPTDPVFTQSEVQGYIARAQNEFLTKVALIYDFEENFPILMGQIYQTLPDTAIDVARVAIPNQLGFSTRLYEVAQMQLSMRDPNWYFNPTSATPDSWFADRAGIYGWGVAPMPQANYLAELICSQRDSMFLELTDGFLVPDIMIHYVKYKAMEYMWTKDGVQQSPTLAGVARNRFDRGVMISTRYLRGFVEAQ